MPTPPLPDPPRSVASSTRRPRAAGDGPTGCSRSTAWPRATWCRPWRSCRGTSTPRTAAGSWTPSGSAASTAEPFGCQYRLLDLLGAERSVTLTGAGDADDDTLRTVYRLPRGHHGRPAGRRRAPGQRGADAGAALARRHRPGQGRLHARLRDRRRRGVRAAAVGIAAAQRPAPDARGAARRRGRVRRRARLGHAAAARRLLLREPRRTARRSRPPGARARASTSPSTRRATCRSSGSRVRSTSRPRTSSPRRSRSS